MINHDNIFTINAAKVFNKAFREQEKDNHKWVTFSKGFSVDCKPDDFANVINLIITGYPLAGHSEDVEFTVNYDSKETGRLFKLRTTMEKTMEHLKKFPLEKEPRQYDLTKSKLSQAIVEVNNGEK